MHDEALDRQREQWSRTYAARPDFMGEGPTEPARAALARFEAAGVRRLLELGPGQGRDTLLFAAAGLDVTALDYAEDGLTQIAEKAAAAGVNERITPVRGDVREPLPFGDATFDGCYSHMLYSMALTTRELERLSAEVHRVLRPDGLVVYTVRNTEDAHYGQGTAFGEAMFEMGGFIVHFFDLGLIERLARDYDLLEVAEYEEGRLPRRLFGVTMRRR